MHLHDEVIIDIKSQYRNSDYMGNISMYGWLNIFIVCSVQTIKVFQTESSYYRYKHNRIIAATDNPTIICL